ncbi:MAG TPA: sigma-70 family RNA polymerase sigma factor [Thermoleophilaceae bacterium]
MSVQRPAVSGERSVRDDESAAWVEALSGGGPRQQEALDRLHALLLRAARFEIARRRSSGDLDDIAHEAADDALVAIMGKLDSFRGDSRFTTWAYKFALLEAGVKLRRRAWEGREVPLEEEGWARLSDVRSSPARSTETSELIDALTCAIRDELSPHQRSVLIALTLNDVPIDVLAERLATTRGALYKTLHDARKKLRTQLAASGFETEGGSS